MNTLPHASALARWLIPAAASAGVVAVVGAMVFGVSAARGGLHPAHRPVLHLASVADGSPALSGAVAAAASGTDSSPGSGRGSSGWRLEGKLPDGPSSGQVHLLAAGGSTRSFVSALASSLGMSGQPQHLKDGWYLVSGSTELSVSELAGRRWTYSNHGCLAGPVLDPQLGVGCAVAHSEPPVPTTPSAHSAERGGPHAPSTSPSIPVSEPVPVSGSTALRTALPVLLAAGVNPDSTRVETAGAQRNVVFSPEVAGLPVIGLQTLVSVDEHAQILDASGWLATTTTGSTYPLISARKGYDQLLAQPQPMILSSMPCRLVAGTQGCLPTPDRVITGVRLGLTQAFSTDASLLLVPAWLFQVRGDATPWAIVAVEGAYLGLPKAPASGATPGAGGVPGNIGGASRTNDSTQNVQPPQPVGQSDAGAAPETKPTQ